MHSSATNERTTIPAVRRSPTTTGTETGMPRRCISRPRRNSLTPTIRRTHERAFWYQWRKPYCFTTRSTSLPAIFAGAITVVLHFETVVGQTSPALSSAPKSLKIGLSIRSQ